MPYEPDARMSALVMGTRNRKVLLIFAFFAVIQFVVGVIFVVRFRAVGHAGAGTLCGQHHSRGLTRHLCTALHTVWNYRVAYVSLSLGFGEASLP